MGKDAENFLKESRYIHDEEDDQVPFYKSSWEDHLKSKGIVPDSCFEKKNINQSDRGNIKDAKPSESSPGKKESGGTQK